MKRRMNISIGVIHYYNSEIETELTDEQLEKLVKAQIGQKLWRVDKELGEFDDSCCSQDLRVIDDYCIDDITEE